MAIAPNRARASARTVAPAGSGRPSAAPSRRPRVRPTRGSIARDEALRAIAAEVSDRLDLDALFGDVLDYATRLFDADRAGLWLIEDGLHPFRLVGHRSVSPQLLEAVAALRSDGWSAGLEAVRRREVSVISRDNQTSPAIGAIYDQDGIETVCFVPIVFRNETLGLLALYHHWRRPWPPDELQLARGFADQMAVAIANARLHGSVQQHAARLAAIGHLGLRLNAIHDVAGIGEAIAAEVGSLIECDTVRVYRVDDATAMCEPIAFRGRFLGIDHPTAEMLRLPIGEGLTGWVAAHGEVVRSGDAGADPRRRFVGRDEGPESMLLVPIRTGEAVLGVIVLSRRGRNRFSADDEALLSTFAGYAALALTSAAYRERAARQQAALELQLEGQRRLLEVNRQLVSAKQPQTVLGLIADALKSLVAYDTLTIYHVDREAGVRRAVLARDRFASEILDHRPPLAAGITGWAIEHGEAVLANDAHLDARSTQIPGTPLEPESLIVVPLVVAGETIGTLNVGRIGADESHFTEAEFELTRLFGAQASIALQNAESYRAAEARAQLDPLTMLGNHGAFQAELGQAVRGSRPFALLMLDLDGFKTYNDAYGHPAGDAVLRQVAGRLASSTRIGDGLYRYGGDEFAVILFGAPREAATEAAARIRRAIASIGPSATAGDGAGGRRVHRRGGRDDEATPIRIGASVGIACFPDDASTADALVACADRALYLAKPIPPASGQSDPRDAYLAALNDTALTLMEHRDPNELLEAILARACEIVGLRDGFLYLLDDAANELVCRIGTGYYADLVGLRVGLAQGVCGRVVRTGEPVVVEDYDRWPERLPSLPRGAIGSVVGLPLRTGDRVAGVIGLSSGASNRAFGERELAVLARLAQLGSIALDNAQLMAAARHELAQRRGLEERLARAAELDAVTGLPNRGALRERVEEVLARPGRDQLGFLLLDLDRFKLVNESLGHAAGDELLSAVATRLQAAAGAGDLVARFGGNEFAVLIERAGTAAEVRRVAERMALAVADPYPIDGREAYLSASAGVVLRRRGVATAADLFRDAEVALHRAKSAGGGGVVVFEPSMGEATIDRLELEAELRRALERDELRLHYQPLVELASGRVSGVEALLRWAHPTRGLIGPAEFVPIAEEAGLIGPIGAWVVERAAQQVRAWDDEGAATAGLSLSVNLSARQLGGPETADVVGRVLRRTALAAERLELEITESILMDSSDAVSSALRDLRAMGVRFTLDDFGTGYSSLSYLRRLPLDALKIDRSFVAGVDSDEADRAIVRAVVALAHGLRIEVVAEGIETAGQHELVRALGCDRGQGFLFARPQAADELAALLRSWPERR